MATKSSKLQQLRDAALALWNESWIGSEGEPPRVYRVLHFWVLVWKSFVRNRCPIRASALSYTTLLALIPLLALAMSVTSSLLKEEGTEQIEQTIENVIDRIVPPAEIPVDTTNAPAMATLDETDVPEQTDFAVTNAAVVETSSTNAPLSRDARVIQVQKEAAQSIKQFIENTSSATIGVTGTILLIFVAISMLSRIEETFNDIWGVTCGRSWYVRIVVYWTTMTLGPALLAGALALASGPNFESTQKLITAMPLVGNIFFKLLPLVVICLAFTFFYKAVPNTKVHFKAALVGGLIAGTMWHTNSLFGFLYVSRVVTNSKIYGSLGLVPVFMAGLYLSWLILLFGAQVAYAFQNRALYLQEKLTENVNQRGREFVALRLMTCIGQRFQRGLRPPTVNEMSNELGIPSRLVQQVLQTLIAAHIVIEIAGPEPAYAPGRPISDITAHHVLMAMRATAGQELMTRDEPVRQEVYGEFARIQEAEKTAACSITILALVDRAEARLQLTPAPDPEEEIKLKPALTPSSAQGPGAPVVVGSEEPADPSASESSNPGPAIAEPAIEETRTPESRESRREEKQAAPATVVVPGSDDDRQFPL